MKMKHASEESLEKITGLLSAIRNFPVLREKKAGLFYKKGRAYLHFHETPDGGLFADIRLSTDRDFVCHNVSTAPSCDKFLALIKKDLG